MSSSEQLADLAVPTLGDPVAAARAAADVIAPLAEEGERLGRLPHATCDALLDRRLMNVLVPEQWGGYGAGHRALFEVIETVSRADGSAGWCVAIGTTNNTGMADGLPIEGLEEVFGSCAGRVVAAGALIPTAVSEPVAGGFQVSGRWGWASGSAHSDWYVVGSLAETDAGGLAIRMHVAPIDECRAVETWNVAGLKATCSRDYVLESVFVPVHRCYTIELESGSFAAAYADRSGASATQSEGSVAVRRGPNVQENTAFGVAGLAAWASGVARRALDELVAVAPTAKRMLDAGVLAEEGFVQIDFAAADATLRAARGAVLEALSVADAELHSTGMSEATRVEVVGASLAVLRAARTATLFAFDAAPASSIYLAHPLQRCLRDLLVGLKHAAGSPGMFAKVGAYRLGRTDHGL